LSVATSTSDRATVSPALGNSLSATPRVAISQAGCQSAADGGVPLKKEDFPAVLIKNWIALSPGYSYGTRINLKNAFCHRPLPGRYQLIGVLTSSGLDGQSINNETVFYPEEIQKLPYPGWKGTVGSNKIWITVDGANRTH
jgi:hypothetical protein